MTYQRTPGIPSATQWEGEAIAVGRYRVPRGSTVTTRSMTQDSEYCMPILCAPGQVLDRVALEVTTLGAGGSVRVGCRQDSGGLPAAAVTELGIMDATSTGTKELTISVTVTGPRIWISVVAQGSAVVVARGMNGQTDNVDVGSNLAATTVYACFNQTGVSGAFPATAPTAGGAGICPIVAVRAAS